jgi:hypothetical protein
MSTIQGKLQYERLGLSTLGDLPGILPRVEVGLRRLQADGRTGQTLANYAESLGAFCDWCVQRGYLADDPLKALAPFDTTPTTHRRAMAAEEIQRLLASCAPHRRLVYEVAFVSGLRANELRNLTDQHLDHERVGLRLDAAWTKNRREGFQRLPQSLMRRLEAFAETCEATELYDGVSSWSQPQEKHSSASSALRSFKHFTRSRQRLEGYGHTQHRSLSAIEIAKVVFRYAQRLGETTDGFSLHAATRIEAIDRRRLERLCRYVIRPPIASGRLRFVDAETLVFTLKTHWADGTCQLLLSPQELLEKLAALVPPPRLNLVRCHGVLAPVCTKAVEGQAITRSASTSAESSRCARQGAPDTRACAGC